MKVEGPVGVDSAMGTPFHDYDDTFVALIVEECAS